MSLHIAALFVVLQLCDGATTGSVMSAVTHVSVSVSHAPIARKLSCATGHYFSISAGCTSCTPGFFSFGAEATSCSSCTSGYYSPAAASNCTVAIHEFDFRGCTKGHIVEDTYNSTLVATPHDGPHCNAQGISFDGLSQYVNITSYSWGGPTSVEIYSVYSSFKQMSSRLFDFGNGQGIDEFQFSHFEATPKCYVDSK
jgi:hypothetical protein